MAGAGATAGATITLPGTVIGIGYRSGIDSGHPGTGAPPGIPSTPGGVKLTPAARHRHEPACASASARISRAPLAASSGRTGAASAPPSAAAPRAAATIAAPWSPSRSIIRTAGSTRRVSNTPPAPRCQLRAGIGVREEPDHRQRARRGCRTMTAYGIWSARATSCLSSTAPPPIWPTAISTWKTRRVPNISATFGQSGGSPAPPTSAPAQAHIQYPVGIVALSVRRGAGTDRADHQAAARRS